MLAQELEADVTVDHSRISNTSFDHLDNLAGDLESYINEYEWTGDRFNPLERIGVDIQITIMGADDSYNFDANIVIRSRRPIYNTMQETPIFIFNDENWSFNYTPNRGFVHDEMQFDALTSLIDFYAYVIIGYDYDTFSELGGTPYFSEAQNIVSIAQVTTSAGWSRSSARRNRAQLISDLLNPNYSELRRATYHYHRLGLDQFIDNPEEARAQILQALKQVQEARRIASNNMLFDIFFDTKYREIVSIFVDAPTTTRLDAYNILSSIDPGHLTEYNKLR